MSTKSKKEDIQLPLKTDVSRFQRQILKWYFEYGRNFPWREKERSAYEKVIAEILLQRTQANTVHKIYINFLDRYPNWKSLSQSTLVEIEEFLRPIGLWKQRAIRLKNLAQAIVDRGDVLPHEREEIEALPNVGQYIGNSIELLLYNRPLPLLDTNMARVLERYFEPRVLVDIRYDPYLQGLSRMAVKSKNTIDLNFAILDLAATICKIRNPICVACPLKDNCRARKELFSE